MGCGVFVWGVGCLYVCVWGGEYRGGRQTRVCILCVYVMCVACVCMSVFWLWQFCAAYAVVHL